MKIYAPLGVTVMFTSFFGVLCIPLLVSPRLAQHFNFMELLPGQGQSLFSLWAGPRIAVY